MSLDIETRDAIVNLFKKTPHNIGSHSLTLNVRYGHVEFDDPDDPDDPINSIENDRIYELEWSLSEIENLANSALNDETIEKDDLLDVISEILNLAE
jgi:ACT domain-containing protein